MDTMQFGYTLYDPSLVGRNETLFTVANGYLGLRGDAEEAEGSYHKGTYINGFYDSEPIVYGETAYGYAKNHETILNLPDPKRIELEVDGLPFSLKRGKVLRCERILDFRTGVLSRYVDWVSEGGQRISLETKRLVSFTEQHCALISYRVTALEQAVKLHITSFIDLGAHNRGAEEDPRIGSKFSSSPLLIVDKRAADDELGFTAKTRNSNLNVYGCAVHRLSMQVGGQTYDSHRVSVGYSVSLEAGQSFELQKYIAYTTEDDSASFLAHTYARQGFGFYEHAQRTFLDEFWKVARVRIEGDDACEQALHFNLFHLLQSCGRDGKTSLAAKGLTGEGYEGHYFWDTEAYALPFFAYVKSEIARSLLEYRYRILDHARTRAKTLSLDGALFPWRTISGSECSAYYPAGTAQYHINADILYAAQKYLAATAEAVPAFIVEMAIESARMWVSLGSFIAGKQGRFCINEVTGPDEYTACVDNNTYTNLMARHNLDFALSLVQHLQKEGRRLPVEVLASELALWKQASESMYLPFDAKLGIYAQDDSFLSKADWPFATTPKEHYPLLLHYHPLVIYRHRVLKQPDTVLAMFLLSGRFSKAEKIRNFSFYEPYTTGDSSLSHCIQSIMASEAGFTLKAWNYFKKTVRMDLDDVHGNSVDGIHTAAMAGSWMSLVYGFGGFRDYQGAFSFDPKLPSAWKSMSFCLNLCSSVVKLHVTSEQASYHLMQGPPIQIRHRMTTFVLDEQEAVFSLKPVLQGVVLDLDGVIVDTARLHYQAWKAVSDSNGLVFNHEVNKQLLGVSRSASFEVILKHNNQSWPEERKAQVLVQKNDLYKASLENLGPKDMLVGIPSFLEELKRAGIKIALASASRNARTVCSKLGILELFDAIADVDRVQLPKPEPDLFLLACEELALYPSDCVGIEDAEAGLMAIKKAGMAAVGVAIDSPLADKTVHSTEDLRLSTLLQLFA